MWDEYTCLVGIKRIKMFNKLREDIFTVFFVGENALQCSRLLQPVYIISICRKKSKKILTKNNKCQMEK